MPSEARIPTDMDVDFTIMQRVAGSLGSLGPQLQRSAANSWIAKRIEWACCKIHSNSQRRNRLKKSFWEGTHLLIVERPSFGKKRQLQQWHSVETFQAKTQSRAGIVPEQDNTKLATKPPFCWRIWLRCCQPCFSFFLGATVTGWNLAVWLFFLSNLWENSKMTSLTNGWGPAKSSHKVIYRRFNKTPQQMGEGLTVVKLSSGEWISKYEPDYKGAFFISCQQTWWPRRKLIMTFMCCRFLCGHRTIRRLYTLETRHWQQWHTTP